jgi:heme exporter protein A
MTLQARGLACVRGVRQLFSGVQVELSGGDALHVRGANGSGKSSLLRILCGLALPYEGAVLWHGVDVRELRSEFARSLVYLGHAAAIKGDLTPQENLVAGSGLAGAPVKARSVARALEAAGLAGLAHIPCRLLSQGQQKRVALARLRLARDSSLWVLDEPFSALDAAASADLVGTLNQHLGRGGMLVYTTHQDVVLDAWRARVLDLGGHAPC